MAEINKRTCFVITPVRNEEDPIRRHIDGIINAVLVPVLGDDYEIVISHKLPDTGSIHKQVIQHIYDSDLVIANLTKKHPVVIYELAFRHSIGTPVIVIAEKGTSLPYFFADKAIYYINDAQGVLELIEKLVSLVDNIDFSKDREGPIYDALRDASNEEYLVKKIEKEYDSLADTGGEEEIEELSETEYAFFRDLLKEENKKQPISAKPEYERYFLQEAADEITEPVTLEQISKSVLKSGEEKGISELIHKNETSKINEPDIFSPASQSGFPGEEHIAADEMQFTFISDIIMSKDFPEKTDADFESLREILKETVNDTQVDSGLNTLRNIFREDEPEKSATISSKSRVDNLSDIMEKLDKLENKISKVVVLNEDHFKDLIEKNEYFNKLIRFNDLYNEINGTKISNKESQII